ncbi:MAG: hypothetical protein ABI405_14605 [Parafilimonas sp.]
MFYNEEDNYVTGSRTNGIVPGACPALDTGSHTCTEYRCAAIGSRLKLLH